MPRICPGEGLRSPPVSNPELTGEGRPFNCDKKSVAVHLEPTYTDHVDEQERITADHRIMGGVPCIRGTRIPAATVVGLIAQGAAVEDVIADFPQLTVDDVRAALAFAAAAITERQLPLRVPA